MVNSPSEQDADLSIVLTVEHSFKKNVGVAFKYFNGEFSTLKKSVDILLAGAHAYPMLNFLLIPAWRHVLSRLHILSPAKINLNLVAVKNATSHSALL